MDYIARMTITQPLLSTGPTCPLLDATVVLLIRLAKSVYKYATDDVLGIRLKEYVTLSNLRDGARAQSELCAAMHMDANNCVLLLNDLEAAGRVERKRDPADRRRHIVRDDAGGPEGARPGGTRDGGPRGRGPRRAHAGRARGTTGPARPRPGGRAGYGVRRGREQCALEADLGGSLALVPWWKCGVGSV